MIWSGLILGVVFGLVVQRGRFCTVALVRETVLRRPVALYMVAIIMLLHTVGVHLLARVGVVTIEEVYFQPISAVLGGLLFGVGMMLAGFCPATIWVRSGEGILAAWIALLSFMLGVESTKAGLFQPFYTTARAYEKEQAFVYQTLEISSWWLVAGLSALCVVWVFLALRNPAPKPFTMPPEHTGLRRILFEARWHPAMTASLFGLIMVAAWYFAEAAGRTTGVAFSGPSGNLLAFLVTGKPALHWGMLFVVGVMFGGFIAARGSGEFRWRVGEPKALMRAAAGGYAMGMGSALASGCIIGHCLINASLFSWQGIVSGVSIVVGASVTALLLYRKKS